MTRVWNLLARIPTIVVAGLLVVGGALIPLHDWVRLNLWDEGEWPQWLGRSTLMWYWAFLPLAVLALWARRRDAQGRLGRVAAWLNWIGGPAQYGVLLVAAVGWGLLLGRGDLPTGFMVVELLSFLIMPGMFLAGIAMLRDRGLPKWQGALVTVLGPAAWLPFGGLAVGLVLSVLLLVSANRHATVLDSPASPAAR